MPGRPDWLPDWTGRTAVVVASGPSASSVDLTPAYGRCGVIAVKTSWRLAPWADAVFACDWQWWSVNEGLPFWTGLKVTINKRASEAPWGVRLLHAGFDHKLIFDDPRRVGWGGNSGFGALNMAINTGAVRVVLVGFDMSIERGLRWHEPHRGAVSAPSAVVVEHWREILDRQAERLAERGIEVIVCGESALRNFRKMPFADAIPERAG